MPLSELAIRNAKPTTKSRKLFDGRGLFLIVTPTGGKWWRFKYRVAGKEKLISLGTYPDISLKVARDSRDKARKLLAKGIDPSQVRKAANEALLANDTFEGTDKLTSSEKCNLANLVQATAAFHSLNALILRFR